MTGPPPPPPYGPPPGGGQPPAYGPPPGGGQPPAYGPPGGFPPPPPLPYPDGYIPPPPPKSSPLKWWLIGGIGLVVLLVLAVVGFVALSLFSKGNTTATDITVGQCLAEIPSGDKVVRVQTTGCDQPHAGEVFAVLTMPDGPFPGQAAVEAYHERCGPALAAYSPSAMADDSVQLYVLYPTADTWSDGDRTVTCIATLDPPRTGSIRG